MAYLFAGAGSSEDCAAPCAVVRGAIYRSIEFMQEKLREDITIDDLAASAMYSKFHYSRVFRQVTGTSPFRFLASMRMREAQRLLRTSDQRVVDITCEIGYSSVGTFSSQFRKRYGLSPSEYRQSFASPGQGLAHINAAGRRGSATPHIAVPNQRSRSVSGAGPNNRGRHPGPSTSSGATSLRSAGTAAAG